MFVLSNFFVCQDYEKNLRNLLRALCASKHNNLLHQFKKSGGAKRTRTADPLNAIEVRYQLRYSPAHSITSALHILMWSVACQLPLNGRALSLSVGSHRQFPEGQV